MTFEEPPTGLIPCFSKTEGNTYATIAASPFPLQGKPTQAQEVAGRISGAVTRKGIDNPLYASVASICSLCAGTVYIAWLGPPTGLITWFHN